MTSNDGDTRAIQASRPLTIDTKRIGNIIRKIRGSRSLKNCAARLGVSHTSLRAYEKGERAPSIEAALNIAIVGGIELDELILGRALFSDRPDRAALKIELAPSRAIEEPDRRSKKASAYISLPLIMPSAWASVDVIPKEWASDYLALPRERLRALGASENLVAMKIGEQSRDPALCEGDTIVIDREIDRTVFDENRFYATVDARYEKVRARRIQKENDLLLLIPSGAKERIEIIDIESAREMIVGRIIAAWRPFEARKF